MLKSILSVFSGTLGMIFKVMLAIGLVVLCGYCFFSLFVAENWAGRLIRIAGIAGSVSLFRVLIQARKDE